MKLKRGVKAQGNWFVRTWAKCRRIIMMCTLTAAGIIAWWMYSALSPMLNSRTGRLTVWGAGHALTPAVEALPWWAWGLVGLVMLYLWARHKILMTLAMAGVAGIVLAII